MSVNIDQLQTLIDLYESKEALCLKKECIIAYRQMPTRKKTFKEKSEGTEPEKQPMMIHISNNKAFKCVRCKTIY